MQAFICVYKTSRITQRKIEKEKALNKTSLALRLIESFHFLAAELGDLGTRWIPLFISVKYTNTQSMEKENREHI